MRSRATPQSVSTAWRRPRGGPMVFVVLMTACMLLPLPALASSMRCSGQLVQTGDPAIAVRNACGAPSFIDPWVASAGSAYANAPSMEEWTYNRGPARLLQILLFRDGKLYRIRAGGYGFVERSGESSCRPDAIRRGMSKYRLLAACGQPAQRTGGFIYSSRGHTGAGEYYPRRSLVPVYRERWIYNFGGNRLLREVTLENAAVVETETLDRGFDE